MVAMVEINEVAKRFGSAVAVQDVSFSLTKGDFLTIVGPSGCGKTTLLQMIAGFENPSAGSISINGENVASTPPYKRSIGMVFQKLALFPHMTAAQNVAYPLKMRRFAAKEISERVSAYLKLVRLEDFADRRPHELSGGQQQRVAIARALSFSPDLLLLDEPLSALDKKLREQMQLEFRRIQQELGVTTINVTHDQREALVMSDQIVVMNEGMAQQVGTPMEIYRAPVNRFVSNFIGMTSELTGTVAAVAGEFADIVVGETTVKAKNSSQLLVPGQPVVCAIRAEQLQVRASDQPPATEKEFDNVVSGIVERCIFEGDRILYEVSLPEMGHARLQVFDHDPVAHYQYPVNSRVTLRWNSRDFFAFPAD